MPQDKLAEELASFEGLWKGGYYEGDPLSVLSKSTYGVYGYVSILHATYLNCINFSLSSSNFVFTEPS